MRTDRPTLIRYERDGDLIRLSLANVSNHELRQVIVGLWCRLGEPDRIDHLLELTHYADGEGAWLSPIACAIKTAEDRESSIDLAALIARGEKIRP